MMSEEVITIIIFFSIFFLMAGNMLNSRNRHSPGKGTTDKSGSLESDGLNI
jgi:hypothetical protein